MHQETVESYVDCKKKLYSTIIEFLDESEEIFQQSFSQFCENMRNYHIEEDREEMTQFLQILKSISNHHHRDENFNQKIKEILQFYNFEMSHKDKKKIMCTTCFQSIVVLKLS